MIQKCDVTDAGPQLTSIDPKMWRDRRRAPTDLHWSKNVTWQTRGPNRPFRCLDYALFYMQGVGIFTEISVHFGVFSTSPFAPTPLSSDWMLLYNVVRNITLIIAIALLSSQYHSNHRNVTLIMAISFWSSKYHSHSKVFLCYIKFRFVNSFYFVSFKLFVCQILRFIQT